MLKTIQSLQGVNILSREAQKKISGGLAQACSMTFQNSSGQWITEQGSCATQTSFSGGAGFGSITLSYCSTASFTAPVALSSNGGESRCGSTTWSPFSGI